jgi:Na+-driven multidrug efflux pump
MGAAGLWIGLIFGLTVAAVLNFLRFEKKTRLVKI